MKLTVQELKNYDGKNGRKAYIAYKGKIYNVSESFLWKNGVHQALHNAGRDLTEELKNAPHGENFLQKFSVVGELISD